MSIYRSYFSKSNTIMYNSYTNTSRNPIVELFYGNLSNSPTHVVAGKNFTEATGP